MVTERASEFIHALNELEATGNVETMVGLYDESAELGNSMRPDTLHGVDGARSFWTSYRRSFRDVHSRFRSVLATGDTAMMEWASAGLLPDGSPFCYEGVSVVEFDRDRVVRFRAYFDTRPAEPRRIAGARRSRDECPSEEAASVQRPASDS